LAPIAQEHLLQTLALLRQRGTSEEEIREIEIKFLENKLLDVMLCKNKKSIEDGDERLVDGGIERVHEDIICSARSSAEYHAECIYSSSLLYDVTRSFIGSECINNKLEYGHELHVKTLKEVTNSVAHCEMYTDIDTRFAHVYNDKHVSDLKKWTASTACGIYRYIPEKLQEEHRSTRHPDLIIELAYKTILTGLPGSTLLEALDPEGHNGRTFVDKESDRKKGQSQGKGGRGAE